MDETLCALALSRLPGIGTATALKLYRAAGSAAAVYERRHAPETLTPDATPRLRRALAAWDEALAHAGTELRLAAEKGIDVLTPAAAGWPRRLDACPDAPLVLFGRGTACLNAPHVLTVVGTRRITEYGKRLCAALCRDLAQLVPGTLIVSGLAYGVDIHAHRAALDAGLPTVAVLAHGLDRIYPPLHRSTAVEMTRHGGLLTEYTLGTKPDKGNFVRRNRIVAGMSDATLVVESASHGGALITARLAREYGRDVLAFPGRTTDEYSAGCNALIRSNGAAMVTSAADVAAALGWQTAAPDKPVQRELFPTLTTEETRVRDLLRGTEGMNINRLAVEANLPVYRLTALLFELEMKGLVKPLPGGRYLWQE